MEHSKELLSISLSNLVPSPFNVRRHSAGQVEELAALIRSQGLLHPLIVKAMIAKLAIDKVETFAFIESSAMGDFAPLSRGRLHRAGSRRYPRLRRSPSE